MEKPEREQSVSRVVRCAGEEIVPLPKIVIDAFLKERWEETRLGCLWYAASVDEGDGALGRRLAEKTIPALRGVLETTPLARMPELDAARRAYKAFGKDPGRFRVSSEALYRRIRQGKELYRINTVVDANNLISLETGFSLGSYDGDRIGDSIVFRRGTAGESYQGIGKGAVDLENMPLLADAAGPFGSPVSDSTRAMITPSATRMLSVIFSFSPRKALEEALALAAAHFIRYAGATDLESGIIE